MEWLDHLARMSNDCLPKCASLVGSAKWWPEEEMERCGAEGLETFGNQ